MFSKTSRLFLAVWLLGGLFGIAKAQTTAATGQITFNTQIFRTGPSPAGVVSGDFNRDGNPDLAVTDFQANHVTILLNQGGGNFNFGAEYSTGSDPLQVVTADFNHDGALDLAIANTAPEFGNNITILLGNGNGTFRPGTPVATGADHPVAIAAADFNRSGIPQLAVVGCNGDADCSLKIYRSNGAGVFTLAQSLPGTFGVISLGMIAIADFNLDGLPDVVVGNAHQVLIFTDTPSGQLQLHTTLTPPNANSIQSLAVGTFNQDSKPDLVVRVFDKSIDDVPSSELIYLNNGSAFFSLRSRISACCLLNRGGFIAAGDLNGDLIEDVLSAGADSRNPGIQYASGRGDGTFNAPVGVVNAAGNVPLIESSPDGLLIRDLTRDSRHDMVATSRGLNGQGVGTYIITNTNGRTNCQTPGSANLAVNICSPAANANVPAQMTVRASGNSPAGVKRLELWVDGVKRAQNLSDQLRATISLSPGTHRMTVVGVDLYGALVKKAIFVHAP